MNLSEELQTGALWKTHRYLILSDSEVIQLEWLISSITYCKLLYAAIVNSNVVGQVKFH